MHGVVVSREHRNILSLSVNCLCVVFKEDVLSQKYSMQQFILQKKIVINLVKMSCIRQAR